MPAVTVRPTSVTVLSTPAEGGREERQIRPTSSCLAAARGHASVGIGAHAPRHSSRPPTRFCLLRRLRCRLARLDDARTHRSLPPDGGLGLGVCGVLPPASDAPARAHSAPPSTARGKRGAVGSDSPYPHASFGLYWIMSSLPVPKCWAGAAESCGVAATGRQRSPTLYKSASVWSGAGANALRQ